MAIKTYRPVTPTLRFKTSLVNDDLTTDTPHKPLLTVRKRTGGRRNTGDLTIRHHGGGHKQKLRMIDFKREKFGVPGRVATIEYDPGRSARIALVHYADGEKRYILQPVGLKVGATVTFDKLAAGWKVVSSALTVRGVVPGIDAATFTALAEAARDACPISGMMKGNVALSVEATLEA